MFTRNIATRARTSLMALGGRDAKRANSRIVDASVANKSISSCPVHPPESAAFSLWLRAHERTSREVSVGVTAFARKEAASVSHDAASEESSPVGSYGNNFSSTGVAEDREIDGGSGPRRIASKRRRGLPLRARSRRRHHESMGSRRLSESGANCGEIERGMSSAMRAQICPGIMTHCCDAAV